MSNITSTSGDTNVTSGARDCASRLMQQQHTPNAAVATANNPGQQQPLKRKRNLPGTPDPDAEVIALSPKTLLTTNRFVCEICHKGFQRDQNLQLHRRGHNLPWKLKQRTSNEIRKRVYLCPETTCVHHDPSRALGDLTGIKKHFCRKHGEKKWKCDKCSKKYAVQSDWKAHLKTCGTREYRCDCGTLFSRRDSFITHRAFCDALAEDSVRVSAHLMDADSQLPGSSLTADHMRGHLAFVGAADSPQRDSSQYMGGHGNPLSSSAIYRTGVSNSISGLASSEGGNASLASHWNHSSGGPRLSLWLGTERGPGPAGVRQMMERSDAPLGSSSFHRSDASNCFMQHTKDMSNGIGEDGMVGLGDFDIRQAPRLLSGMVPGTGGLFHSFQKEHESSQLQNVGISNLGGGMNQLERGTHNAAGRSRSSSTGFAGSMAPQHQHATASTAQMSATALLQKAAQMGATSSNPSFLKGFGLGAGKDQGNAGVPNMFVGSLPPFPSMRRPPDLSAGSHGLSNSAGSSSSGGHERFIENSDMQDFMNPLLKGSKILGSGFGSQPSLYASQIGSGIVSGMLPPTNMQPYHVSRDKGQNIQPNTVRGASPSQGAGPLSSFGGFKKGEDGTDRPTLDFLGVGAAGVVGRTLSQRDLTSISPFSSAMDLGSFRRTGHSPGRSLDSS